MKGRLDSSDRVELEEFIKVVRRDRIISVNTEGHEDKTGEDKPLVMVAVSNLDKRVIFFADAMEMSREVRDLLTDVSIAKLGSGLNREGEELHRIRIKMRGWISSGALYRAFLRKKSEDRPGSTMQVFERVLLMQKVPLCQVRLEVGKGAQAQFPGENSLGVLVPCLHECSSTTSCCMCNSNQVCWRQKVAGRHPFDLVRMKLPEDLVRISDKPQENWVANLPDGLDYSQHLQLNNCRELTFLRKAQADFIKVYEEFYQLGARTVEAYHLYLDLRGRRWPLPIFTMGKRGAVREYLTRLCSTCGSPHDRHERCNKKSEIPPCSYKHNGVKGLGPHTIRTCPVLHMYCGWCFMRGHDPPAHHILKFTHREL